MYDGGLDQEIVLQKSADGWDGKKNGFRDYPMGPLGGSARVYLDSPAFEVVELDQHEVGYQGGLRVGDRIVAANGVPFPRYDNDPESGGKGGGLPKVAAEADDAQVRIAGLELAQHLEAVVSAAIVHSDDLVTAAQSGQHRAQLGVQRRQVPGLVIDREDDGQVKCWFSVFFHITSS